MEAGGGGGGEDIEGGIVHGDGDGDWEEGGAVGLFSKLVSAALLGDVVVGFNTLRHNTTRTHTTTASASACLCVF